MSKTVGIMLMLSFLSFSTKAQWKVGATLGWYDNSYTSNANYLTDFYHEGIEGGFAPGLMVQYDFKEYSWMHSKLAVRAELDLVKKSHRQWRYYGEYAVEPGVTDIAYYNFYAYNDYLHLPVMLNYSVGFQKLKLFVNVGAYMGYWIKKEGKILKHNFTYPEELQWSERKEISFNKGNDQRVDIGLVGGAGIEWMFLPHFSAQIEARSYISMSSTTKDYMEVKVPQFYKTLALQASLCYFF